MATRFEQEQSQSAATATTGSARRRPLARKLIWRVDALRLAFCVIWAIDAYYKWQPDFVKSYATTIASAAKGQPDSLRPWFHFWRHLVLQSPHVFAYATAVVETMIALGLLLGLARRMLYIGGALWSLAIWTIPEGFGGSFVAGATDIGTAIVYALVFAALYSLEALPAATGRLALDRRIERRLHWWRLLAEPLHDNRGGLDASQARARFAPHRGARRFRRRGARRPV
jgi:nitrite reductase (NO-forming)